MKLWTQGTPKPGTIGANVRAELFEVLSERFEPLSGPVVLKLRFVFKRNGSTDPTPTSEASLPGLVRAVLDELPGVVYGHEGQVVALHVGKEYGNVAGVWLSW